MIMLKEKGQVLRRALDLEVKSQMSKKTWKKQVRKKQDEEESIKFGFSGEDAF